MPMAAPDSSPPSSNIREKSAVALFCRKSFVIAIGLPTRRYLALLHYNDSDRFLHTKEQINPVSPVTISRLQKNVKDQATALGSGGHIHGTQLL